MELKEFSKYLKYGSFDHALHQARRKSLERILTLERFTVSVTKRRKAKAKEGVR